MRGDAEMVRYADDRVPRRRRKEAEEAKETAALLHKRWGRAPRSRHAGAGSKPLRAAAVKSRGGERRRKGAARSRQVRIMETNASEPLMTCRKRRNDVKTGTWSLARDKSSGDPAYWLGGVRHEGGVNMIQALVWNVGTCRLDVKGKIQVEDPRG